MKLNKLFNSLAVCVLAFLTFFAPIANTHGQITTGGSPSNASGGSLAPATRVYNVTTAGIVGTSVGNRLIEFPIFRVNPTGVLAPTAQTFWYNVSTGSFLSTSPTPTQVTANLTEVFASSVPNATPTVAGLVSVTDQIFGGRKAIGSATTSFSLTAPEMFLVDGGASVSTTPFKVMGSINDFMEVKIKNSSTGLAAQSGFTAEADNGTAISGYAWVGINNSGFNTPATYNVGLAGDVSFVGSGNDLYLSNAATGRDIFFTTRTATTPFYQKVATVKSDGKIGIGIGNTAPATTLHIQGQTTQEGAYREISTSFATNGNTNNATFAASNSVVYLTGTAAQNITGIVPPTGGLDGYSFSIVNRGAVAATLTNNSASSLVANRIQCPGGYDYSLQPNQSVTLRYISATAGWVVGSPPSSLTPTTQRLTASGTYTTPVGLKYAIFELYGGGAGGANTLVSAATTISIGSGGGAGGYCKVRLTAAQIGASQTFVLGAGGAGGQAGGASTFGTVTMFTAFGGSPGVASAATASNGSSGGLGGGFSIVTGVDLGSRNGEQGQGGLGLVTAGTTVLAQQGAGGSTFLAPGGRHFNQGVVGAQSGAGAAATANTGGGGGGAISAAGGAAATGGAAGSGVLFVTEFYQ